MGNTSISWTEKSWNFTTGCDKISEGCLNCYACRRTKRLQQNPKTKEKYKNGWKFTIHPEELQEPYKWRKPCLVFVESMSDVFHKENPIEFIKQVFRVMNDNPQHIFQVLTKRADILEKLAPQLNWTDNIWAGVSVENKNTLNRIDCLKNAKGIKHRFLSCEPLLESLGDIDLTGIDWVIVGGESGPGWRPIKKEWIEEIHEACIAQKSVFFFKQWSGFHPKKLGNELNGKVYEDFPPEMERLLEENYKQVQTTTENISDEVIDVQNDIDLKPDVTVSEIKSFIMSHGADMDSYAMAKELHVKPIRIAASVAALKRAGMIGNDFLFEDKQKAMKKVPSPEVQQTSTIAQSPTPQYIQEYILVNGKDKSTYEMAASLGVKPIRIAGGVAALKRAKKIGNDFLFDDRTETIIKEKSLRPSTVKAIDKKKVKELFNEYEKKVNGLLKELSEKLQEYLE